MPTAEKTKLFWLKMLAFKNTKFLLEIDWVSDWLKKRQKLICSSGRLPHPRFVLGFNLNIHRKESQNNDNFLQENNYHFSTSS